MSIAYQILGGPGRDNALLVRLDRGNSVDRLLFDCGEDVLDEIDFAEIQQIDHLFFSHLHMDHVGGFDAYFRAIYDRTTRPNRIWGPPETARILQHRLQGYLWNLHAGMSASWRVHDLIAGDSGRFTLHTTRFELHEAFSAPHAEGQTACGPTILDGPRYSVDAFAMEHRTPTIAYLVREKPRHNIDMTRLAALGLSPGPWMKPLKDPGDPTPSVVVAGQTRSVHELRAALVAETPGDSIAYLTDFLLDEAAIEALADKLRGVQTIVCEGQYRHADLELARRHFHMTTVLSARLAARANAGRLVLFHLSVRYTPSVWREMLREAQAEFPATQFAPTWNLAN